MLFSVIVENFAARAWKSKLHADGTMYEGMFIVGIETIEKIETVVDGLPAKQAYLLGQIIRYCDRAGLKDDVSTDLGKANNYAHRLVYGEWRDA